MASCERNFKPLDTTYYYLLKANESSGQWRGQGRLLSMLIWLWKMALDVGFRQLTIAVIW